MFEGTFIHRFCCRVLTIFFSIFTVFYLFELQEVAPPMYYLFELFSTAFSMMFFNLMFHLMFQLMFEVIEFMTDCCCCHSVLWVRDHSPVRVLGT